MNSESVKNEAFVLFNQAYDNKNIGGMRFIATTIASMFGDGDEATIEMKRQIKSYLPF